MNTTTRRLPKGLKKKLEASLGDLTPRQAARLFLIYYHEGDRKRIGAGEYPPIRELKAALEEGIKKGKTHEERQRRFALYNGFMFFVMLAIDANKDADEEFFKLALRAVQNHSMLASLMRDDYTSETVKQVIDIIQYNAHPVRPEDYDRLIEWTKTDALIELGDYADNFTVEWDHTKHTQETYQALCDAEYEKLIERVESGEIEGGIAVWLNSEALANLVLVEDNKYIPAWAALRAIWRSWLYDRDYLVKNEPTFDDASIKDDDTAIAGLRQVYNAAGDVTGDALVRLARAFFEDCKAKPWGGELTAPATYERLARFLIEIETDLTELTAPDLGLVDLVAFAQAEAGIDATPYWVATNRGLTEFNGDDFDWSDAIRDNYYPTLNPGHHRAKWNIAVKKLSALRVDRPSFSYKRIARRDEGDDNDDALVNLRDVYDEEFLTPLEEEVKNFAALVRDTATLKRFCEIISNEYFGGLPLLVPSIAAKLEYLDQTLDHSEEYMTAWSDYVRALVPNVDMSSLQMIRPPAVETLARKRIEGTIEYSKYMLRLSDREEFDLGPEDDVDQAAKARRNSQHEPAPAEAVDEGSEEE